MFKPNYSAFSIVIIVLFSCLLFGIFVFNNSSYPERAIVGEWREVSWTYTLGKGEKDQSITEEERHSISNQLIIHQSETWRFFMNYKLELKKKNKDVQYLKWHLKGRGHILNIKNVNGIQEVYSIESLSKNKMVLHFETDVQARGIVKITLERNKNVTKI